MTQANKTETGTLKRAHEIDLSEIFGGEEPSGPALIGWACGTALPVTPNPNESSVQIAFRDKQELLLPAIYRGDAAAIAEYEANITTLTPEQLSTWHAAHVDPEQFEVYHNCYKSDNGFRPRGFITLAGMKAWLAQRDAKEGTVQS